MSTIPTKAATQLPTGAKIVKSTPTSPVTVTRMRTVGIDKQTIELQLEQMFESPINGQAGMLAFTMAGHSAFNTGPRKKVTWQNFSTKRLIELGIINSWEQVGDVVTEYPDAPSRKGELLCNFPLVFRDAKGQQIPLKIVEVDTFEPRRWVSRNGEPMEQQPKRAGQEGDILTYDSKKIYRNTGLAMPGTDDLLTGRAWDEDLVILHNNQIVGSSVRTAMSKAGIAIPLTPGTPSGTGAVNTATNTGTSEPNDMQNRGIGETRNLVEGAQEPTRHTPDEQLQEVSEKTLAEQQRESGERSVTQ